MSRMSNTPMARSVTFALAPAKLVLGDEVREGLVHVTSGEALIGIDFLRAFRKTFVLSVTSDTVLLVDASPLREIAGSC